MLENRRVVVRCCARWLLAGAAVTWSVLASALGLGQITLHSALNQPLRADIALVDAAGLEEGELVVSLATADEFSRAGVERGLWLNDLQFTPILRGQRSLIQVTSSKPVNEPFLNFLVQLDQPNGRLMREYTVLIDPPGAPGIVPASDEPLASRPSSALASVQPAVAPEPAPKEALPEPSTAPVADPFAEQLAASVLQNQQLQATVNELNAKLQAKDEQIAGEKTQVTQLQARLAEVKSAPMEPVAPVPASAVPMIVEQPGPNWLLIGGLLVLVALLVIWRRRQRQQDQATFGPVAGEPSRQEPQFSPAVEKMALMQPPAASPEVTPVGDVLEATLSPVAPVAVATAVLAPKAIMPEPILQDEFQLNLDDLSMDTHWDLGPVGNPSASGGPSNEFEITWDIGRPLAQEKC